MANNYSAFSEMYPLAGEDDREEAQKVISHYVKTLESREESFNFNAEIKTEGLWIYGDGEDGFFDEEQIVEFIQLLLSAFNDSRSFIVSFSETCSKPRLAEFSGGAVVITQDNVEGINARGWAMNLAKDHSNVY